MNKELEAQLQDENKNGSPENWIWVRLDEIAEINPKLMYNNLSDRTKVSFLPMRHVEEQTGLVDLSLIKEYQEVKKGYTPFVNEDIIFAKITPCMENGKIAIVKNLKNGIGFGSTEFHVIRLIDQSIPTKFLFYYFLRQDLRKDAQRNMSGTAGQLRVPLRYMKQIQIPLPPLQEQYRIVSKLEQLFTKLDAGIAALKKIKTQLKNYRRSVLKYAFEGKLTERWHQTEGTRRS